MKKLVALLLVTASFGALSAGCAYGPMVGDQTATKVVILRQDGFLFGALRAAFVCKVTDAGLSSCQEGESP